MEKKTLAILLLIAALFTLASFQLSNSAEIYLNNASLCMECHKEIHVNLTRTDNSIMELHNKPNFTCLDCHSGGSMQGTIESRKTLAAALLLKIIKMPLQNFSGYNVTYRIDFAPIAANCTKCHPGINTTKVIKDLRRLDPDPFSAKILRGPHVNKTCNDCHAANFVPVNCTKCHIPHKEDANWGYKECVGCHTNPHVPVRNGTYTTDISRALCATCHPRQYQLTEIGGGKHKDQACSRCHPVHRTMLTCKNCHGHPVHAFKDEKGEKRDQCYMCHGYATCKDCHPPHTPKLYLPTIDTNKELEAYAKQAHNTTFRR